MSIIRDNNQHTMNIVFKLLIDTSIFTVNRIIIIIGSFIMITALLILLIADLLITLSDYIKRIRIKLAYNTKSMDIHDSIEDTIVFYKNKIYLHIENNEFINTLRNYINNIRHGNMYDDMIYDDDSSEDESSEDESDDDDSSEDESDDDDSSEDESDHESNTESLEMSSNDIDIVEKEEEYKNKCTICDVDMGPSNPRQLCGKTYCINDDGNTEEDKDKDKPNDDGNTEEDNVEEGLDDDDEGVDDNKTFFYFHFNPYDEDNDEEGLDDDDEGEGEGEGEDKPNDDGKDKYKPNDDGNDKDKPNDDGNKYIDEPIDYNSRAWICK